MTLALILAAAVVSFLLGAARGYRVGIIVAGSAALGFAARPKRFLALAWHCLLPRLAGIRHRSPSRAGWILQPVRRDADGGYYVAGEQSR
jgi:hypothetical protein